jgi:hypothetical protein
MGTAGVVTEAACAELLASFEREEEDLKAGRVTRMSVAEFGEEIQSDFERITGDATLRAGNTPSIDFLSS